MLSLSLKPAPPSQEKPPMPADPPPIKDTALFLATLANEKFGRGGDPRFPYIALMTAAAVAGHIIEQSPEKMHAVLDQVLPVALAAMLEATETKQ